MALTWLLFFGAVILGAIWAQDDLKLWLQSIVAAVQTPALGHCEAPVEGERMMIIVAKRHGKLVLESCMFVGSTGTYGHRPR